MPRNLYEFLPEALIRAQTPETSASADGDRADGDEQAGADPRACRGRRGHSALNEARGGACLRIDRASRWCSTHYLGEFLIERLRGAGGVSTSEIVDPLIGALRSNRSWDECLAVSEALPEASTLAPAILDDCFPRTTQ